MEFYIVNSTDGNVPTVYEVENGVKLRSYALTPDMARYNDITSLISRNHRFIKICDQAMADAVPWASPNTTVLAEQARNHRNNLLQSTVDRMNPMRWELLSEEERSLWHAYRQALLDIPTQAGFPVTITWPELPNT